MKRIGIVVTLCLLLLSVFCCLCSGYSESSIDYSDMPFDDLLKLKQAVDAEYFSREEADILILGVGTYKIGTDIKPGRYFIIENARIALGGSYWTTYFIIYDVDGTQIAYKSVNENDRYTFTLSEGETIEVTRNEIQFRQIDYVGDYYAFDIPNSVYVPSGQYKVGVDIPAGKYCFYKADYYATKLEIGSDETFSSYKRIYLNYYEGKETERYELKDGYVFYCNRPIYITKAADLKFFW